MTYSYNNYTSIGSRLNRTVGTLYDRNNIV